MTALEWKLQVVVLPVSDVDRAKAFYLEQVGFDLQVDHRAGESFRVVHLIPRGSAVAVALMKNELAAGSVSGLQLVVTDIEAAHAELVEGGVDPGDLVHFVDGEQQPGPHPGRGDYESFFSFSDPDGNQWMVQEVREAAAR